MDQNQTPTPPIQNPTPVVPPVQSPVPPAPSNPTPSAPKSNGKIILFIAVGILLLIILGAIYFMATQLNNRTKAPEVTPTPIQVSATPTPTPTPPPLSEKDIDTIDLGSPEADLKNIEEDVKQL